MGSIGQYILALLVVALMLFGLYTVVRALGRGRLVASADRRLVTVVESTLSRRTQRCTSLKSATATIGRRRQRQRFHAGQVPAEQVEPWISEQRNLFNAQTQSLTGFLKQLRKPQLRTSTVSDSSCVYGRVIARSSYTSVADDIHAVGRSGNRASRYR